MVTNGGVNWEDNLKGAARHGSSERLTVCTVVDFTEGRWNDGRRRKCKQEQAILPWEGYREAIYFVRVATRAFMETIKGL